MMKQILITFLLSLSCAQADVARPNILLVLIDDMGPMDTSLPFLADAQGKPEKHPLNEFYHTPEMEKLAAQGFRSSRFYANSVCSPTRASLMNGQKTATATSAGRAKPTPFRGWKNTVAVRLT